MPKNTNISCYTKNINWYRKVLVLIYGIQKVHCQIYSVIVGVVLMGLLVIVLGKDNVVHEVLEGLVLGGHP